MTKLENFFYDNAGYSYNPIIEAEEEGHVRCAKYLAKAYEDAELIGIDFKWNYDDDADWSWMDKEERDKDHCVEWCTATNPITHKTSSLCGIFDADENYRRVIEAELASELL